MSVPLIGLGLELRLGNWEVPIQKSPDFPSKAVVIYKISLFALQSANKAGQYIMYLVCIFAGYR